MLDRYGRKIEYLRISVTDRCDLRCLYCMPARGVPLLRHEEILSFEEICRLTRLFALLGVRHLRITGGEPTVRRGLWPFVAALHEIPGIESIGLTSNGQALAGQLKAAMAAGLTSLNLSLDALAPALYARMTRGGDARRVLAALNEALALGLPVKLNCVPVRGLNEGELKPLAALAKDKAIDVRFIELMPLGCGRDLQPVPPEEVLSRLENTFGASEPDTRRHGNGPAVYRRFPGFSGAVGFIGALSACFCETCNRVRLTSDGRLKLCLNHTAGLDLRALLRAGASDDEILRKIARAIELKPARHEFFKENRDAEVRRMNEIGG